MKKKRIQERKKQFYAYKKTFNAVFKNGFNPVLGSIPRLPKIQKNKKIHGSSYIAQLKENSLHFPRAFYYDF